MTSHGEWQPIETDQWVQNEHGLWCPACGELLAAPWNIDEDFEPPETCRTCGFPDFEDGPGYFVDDDYDPGRDM